MLLLSKSDKLLLTLMFDIFQSLSFRIPKSSVSSSAQTQPCPTTIIVCLNYCFYLPLKFDLDLQLSVQSVPVQSHQGAVVVVIVW